MNLEAQLFIFVVLILFLLYFIFFKVIFGTTKLFSKRLKKIKKEWENLDNE